MASVVGTYDMSVCGDCVYWAEYRETVSDIPDHNDGGRIKGWREIAYYLGTNDLVMGSRDVSTGEVCAHDYECYCHEPYFSHRDCDLCGQIAGNRYDVIVTGFKSSKVGA